jgi:hypothetical protein
MEVKMKYGFVYTWKDCGRNRFYIGSHWGTEDDGYVCSSDAMRKAYRRRPQDFKRRIVARVYTNHSDLLKEEQRWLDMISKEEFGTRYYNVNSKTHGYYWWANGETKRIVGQKISSSHKNNAQMGKWNIGKKRTKSEKQNLSYHAKKQWAEGKHQTNHLKGENRTEAQKEGNRLQATAMKGRKSPKHAQRMKALWASGRYANRKPRSK